MCCDVCSSRKGAADGSNDSKDILWLFSRGLQCNKQPWLTLHRSSSQNPILTKCLLKTAGPAWPPLWPPELPPHQFQVPPKLGARSRFLRICFSGKLSTKAVYFLACVPSCVFVLLLVLLKIKGSSDVYWEVLRPSWFKEHVMLVMLRASFAWFLYIFTQS